MALECWDCTCVVDNKVVGVQLLEKVSASDVVVAMTPCRVVSVAIRADDQG